MFSNTSSWKSLCAKTAFSFVVTHCFPPKVFPENCAITTKRVQKPVVELPYIMQIAINIGSSHIVKPWNSFTYIRLIRISHGSEQLRNKLASQPSPPGIRQRRSRWRTGKARRPGAFQPEDVVFYLEGWITQFLCRSASSMVKNLFFSGTIFIKTECLWSRAPEFNIISWF